MGEKKILMRRPSWHGATVLKKCSFCHNIYDLFNTLVLCQNPKNDSTRYFTNLLEFLRSKITWHEAYEATVEMER